MKIKIHRTTILIVFYVCEAWSLILRERHRLRMFENRVLRKTFRRKRDEETREWRRLHIEELYELYSLANIIRVIKSRSMRWAGRVACTLSFWLGDNLEYISVDGDNIKMDLKQMGGGGRGWITWAQARYKWRAIVNLVKNTAAQYNAGNFLTSWGPVSFSERTPFHEVSSGTVMS